MLSEMDLKEKAEEKRITALVAEIRADFTARQKARREIELGWELNMNFFSGNQYCDVTSGGELTEEEQKFFWQSRRVFNCIAPTVDVRHATLERNRPALRVKPFSDAKDDYKQSAMASGILKSVAEKIRLNEIFSRGTLWSEVCGTVFYKVSWNGEGEGEVDVEAISPFEIFPDNLACEREEDLRSLIHARAVPCKEIYRQYGVSVQSEENIGFAALPYSASTHFSLKSGTGNKTEAEDYVILIERYTMPEANLPQGKLEVVAGDKLLYEGALPYINKENGKRGFPFVKQTSMPLPGAFFGGSIVDRLIPIQRAYNAVRNRKHEFLNRLAMGVMAVEDGSVDTDELSEDGLCPGKIIVYRQGSEKPSALEMGEMPTAFESEEERIREEFRLISGTNILSSQQSGYSGVTSATGVQLLLNREDQRMATTIGQMVRATEEVARHILRLYKQFATLPRLARMTDENKKEEIFYFNSSDVCSENILFEGDNELTAENKRTILLELLDKNVLCDEYGKLSVKTKHKICELFGVESFLDQE